MNETISTLHKMVEECEPNICEITVMQDGEVRYEDYWHGYQPGDALNVMSVTKSAIALLTGIAMDKGYIQSIDQKVLDFFPEYTVKRGEKTIYDVTIRHLLTMTAPYISPKQNISTKKWSFSRYQFLYTSYHRHASYAV